MVIELFKDIIPAIQSTKVDVFQDSDAEKKYVPFLVNRALSQYMDTILFANEMNQRAFLDKKLQFDYLLYTVRAYKRPFRKWHKFTKPDDLDVVKEYYGYSDTKAIEALSILTDDQIQQIKKKLYKGGVDNARKDDRGKTKGKK